MKRFAPSFGRLGLVAGVSLCTAIAVPGIATAQNQSSSQSDQRGNQIAEAQLQRNLARITNSSGPRQTVVLTQRPLRTFRGVPVTAGRYANDDLSIGVVRPIRIYPDVDPRTAYSAYNRFDRSDRWALRELARGRILLNVSPNPYARVQESIGVVRPFRTYDPVVRNSPRTWRNEDAVDTPSIASQYREMVDGQISVTALADVQVPDAAAGQPWALLSEGYYREAREAFGQVQAEDAATQTGRALAAALNGDLASASELMPADPRVPAEASFSDTSRRRIDLARQYLFEGDQAMQDALQSILDQARPTGESMQ